MVVAVVVAGAVFVAVVAGDAGDAVVVADGDFDCDDTLFSSPRFPHIYTYQSPPTQGQGLDSADSR